MTPLTSAAPSTFENKRLNDTSTQFVQAERNLLFLLPSRIYVRENDDILQSVAGE